MADTSPLRPFCVALSFADNGPLWTSTILAPTPEIAVAIFSHLCMQQAGVPSQSLYGVAVTPIDLDWLRTALRAVEGKLPAGGTAQIVSLVHPPGRNIEGDGGPLPPPYVGPDRPHIWPHEFGPWRPETTS